LSTILAKETGRGKNKDMFQVPVCRKGYWQTGPKKVKKYDINEYTWLPRSALKKASYKVGKFEHPEKFLNLKQGLAEIFLKK
jgi:hypothetical protein